MNRLGVAICLITITLVPTAVAWEPIEPTVGPSGIEEIDEARRQLHGAATSFDGEYDDSTSRGILVVVPTFFRNYCASSAIRIVCDALEGDPGYSFGNNHLVRPCRSIRSGPPPGDGWPVVGQPAYDVVNGAVTQEDRDELPLCRDNQGIDILNSTARTGDAHSSYILANGTREYRNATLDLLNPDD